MNDLITSPNLRVIDAEGQQLGIISRQEAMKLAEKAELDLVEISPQAEPPVCRIMNFGKYQYEITKKRAAQKKQQVRVQIKGVQFRPNTEEGDYQVKLRHIGRFLEQGDKAKITLRFRGREIAHQELGMRLLERLQKDLQENVVVEQLPRLEGKQMTMVLAPKKSGQKT